MAGTRDSGRRGVPASNLRYYAALLTIVIVVSVVSHTLVRIFA
jgi:hypothetical protein